MVDNLSIPDLIILKPWALPGSQCVHCAHTEIDQKHIFQGIHTLVQYYCPRCNRGYFETLPIGHDFLFPVTLDVQEKKASPALPAWLVAPLEKALFHGAKAEVAIEKKVIEQKSDAIILNCLDSCFGHAFTKLWNASILKEKYPDQSLIVFIPKSMQWLVPDGTSEVWAFDAPLSELQKYLVNLDDEVKKNLLPRFNNVWMSKAYTHLDLDKVNLQAMLRTDRFDLEKFSVDQPSITFVLREDRFWHRYSWEFFLFKVFFKLGLSKKVFANRQNRLVSRTAKLIRRALPDVHFSAAGLGKSGRFSKIINDNRKSRLTDTDEIEWCRLYARSHIVVGIHGSNMLIPTALAAGFIEILPRHKIRHMAEDTTLDYNSRYSFFLGRHLDHFVSPKLVARHAISMISDFPYVHKNAGQTI